MHIIARKRSSLSDDVRFEVLYDRAPEGEKLPIAGFARAERIEDLPKELLEKVRKCPDLLITTAVRTEHMRSCQQFILDLAAARYRNGVLGTVFIACENDPGPHFPTLERRLTHLEVDCRRTIVNRLCHGKRWSAERGCLQVSAARLAEWVIEGAPTPAGTLGALSQLSFVHFVDDIQPREMRKRWLINGPHLATAVMARTRKQVTMSQATAEPGRIEWLIELERVLIESLEHNYPGMTDNQRYVEANIATWIRERDEVGRILRRLKRTDLLPFFEDFDRKFGEPIKRHPRIGSGPDPHVLQVLDALHKLLKRAESYADFANLAVELPKLPLRADGQALQRYGRLLRGILTPYEIGMRVDDLQRAFERHRERFS